MINSFYPNCPTCVTENSKLVQDCLDVVSGKLYWVDLTNKLKKCGVQETDKQVIQPTADCFSKLELGTLFYIFYFNQVRLF
jgi:CCR4-NOT transcriptional regulation complex NOT5 subunit